MKLISESLSLGFFLDHKSLKTYLQAVAKNMCSNTERSSEQAINGWDLNSFIWTNIFMLCCDQPLRKPTKPEQL